ncbi:MAG TPA: FAD-dependent oxidoreductase [Caulobacteraceae bacterium]|jgi:flavin-dependent dehydrogenase
MTQPVLVIGGGLSGAAAATHLARAGRETLLLEREAAPHDKVCGEFLSYEARAYVSELGVDAEALGGALIGAVEVRRRLARKRAPLAFTAVGLSRRALDEAVLKRAAEAGAEIRRGVRATELERNGDYWSVRTNSGPPFTARHVFLATGKHDIRGWKRPAGSQPDLMGFKLHWRLAPEQARALDGQVELHLFGGGYAGLEMVEGERANLCLVVRKAVFSTWGGGWDGLLSHLLDACPSLEERLEAARPLAPRPQAIGAIPYGYVRDRSDGLWRLGDQAAVIPSFTGEGMSMALHSARLATRFFLEGREPDDFQRRLARDVRCQVRTAMAASRLLVVPAAQAVIARSLNRPMMQWIVSRTRLTANAQAICAEEPWARRRPAAR